MMEYVPEPRNSRLLLAYESVVVRREKRIRYDALENSGEDLMKGCEGIVGCGCLGVVVWAGLLVGELYWFLR